MRLKSYQQQHIAKKVKVLQHKYTKQKTYKKLFKKKLKINEKSLKKQQKVKKVMWASYT